MRPPSPFELEVLERVGSDYEAPHTISGDIARDLGRAVSDDEVRDALLVLAAQGLVRCYLFESSTDRYRAVTLADAKAAEAPWFMASSNVKGTGHAT